MTGIFRLLVLIGLFVAVYFGYRAYRRWRHKQTVKEFKKAPVRDVSTVADDGQASLKWKLARPTTRVLRSSTCDVTRRRWRRIDPALIHRRARCSTTGP